MVYNLGVGVGRMGFLQFVRLFRHARAKFRVLFGMARYPRAL